jgi:hypothetical protein
VEGDSCTSVLAADEVRRSRRTPISPLLVKCADLLRPIVESRRRATVSDTRRITGSLSEPSSFPAQVPIPMSGRAPTPIEAQTLREAIRRAIACHRTRAGGTVRRLPRRPTSNARCPSWRRRSRASCRRTDARTSPVAHTRQTPVCQQLPALPHEMKAASEEIAGGPHRRRVDIRLR